MLGLPGPLKRRGPSCGEQFHGPSVSGDAQGRRRVFQGDVAEYRVPRGVSAAPGQRPDQVRFDEFGERPEGPFQTETGDFGDVVRQEGIAENGGDLDRVRGVSAEGVQLGDDGDGLPEHAVPVRTGAERPLVRVPARREQDAQHPRVAAGSSVQLLGVGAVDQGCIRGAPLGVRVAGDGVRGEGVGGGPRMAEQGGYRPEVQGEGVRRTTDPVSAPCSRASLSTGPVCRGRCASARTNGPGGGVRTSCAISLADWSSHRCTLSRTSTPPRRAAQRPSTLRTPASAPASGSRAIEESGTSRASTTSVMIWPGRVAPRAAWARATRAPAAPARSASRPSRAVFPIPGSPATSRTTPRPSASPSTTAERHSICVCLPTSAAPFPWA